MRALVFVMLFASVANAETDRSEGKQTGLVVLGGLDLGIAHAADTGALVGGELSLAVVHFKSGYFERNNPNDFFYLPSMPVWGGIYADVVRDFSADATRVSFGPELGYGPIGIDGGLVFQGDRSGWVVRPVITASFLQLYFRYGRFTDELPDRSFQEVGLLVKFGKNVLAW